ncbi:MAG: hypothetical protein HFI35_09355 [Roseburia sp.]|jgi:hypothetical protein|nr:hypothetical protein [Roseburia sp.]
MKKVREWMDRLPETVTVTRREGMLAMLVCLLAGIIVGMICSPRKNVMMGSYNGHFGTNPDRDDGETESDEADPGEEYNSEKERA